MDIKHVLSANPLHPRYATRPGDYRGGRAQPEGGVGWRASGWLAHPGGPVEIGHAGRGFAFDNESPRHRALVTPFALADRPVTCGDWLEFIDDGGYGRPELWLSDGWAAVPGRGLAGPALLVARTTAPVGRCSPWPVTGRSIRPSRSATSATTRPTPSPTGRATVCPRRRSGRPSPRAEPSGGQLPRSGRAPATGARTGPPTLRRRLGVDVDRLQPVPRVPGRRPARSVSTTGSSWSTSTCCGAVPAPPRRSRPRHLPQLLPRRRPAGPSAACGWPGTSEQ